MHKFYERRKEKNDEHKKKLPEAGMSYFSLPDKTVLPDLTKYWTASSAVYDQIKDLWGSSAFKWFSDLNSVTSNITNRNIFPYSYYSNLFWTNQNQIQLKEEINKIQKELFETQKEFERVKASKKEAEAVIKKWQQLAEDFERKNWLLHISSRICSEASQRLFDDEKFRNLFIDWKECKTVVVSIDIRRSTELMLKARTPQLFAKFITELSQKLSEVIIRNYGIFDKFTGDGILAFFPDFYSWEDAIGFAINAAKECHQVFTQHYNNCRSCFNVFIKSVGLWIGIDYGTVTLVNNNHSLTVVWVPVVYACRMSWTEAWNTILNQPARELAEDLYKKDVTIKETEIIIKHEGPAVAYSVELSDTLTLKKPNWGKQ